MAQRLDRKLHAGKAFPDLALNLFHGKQSTVAAYSTGPLGRLTPSDAVQRAKIAAQK